MTNHLSAGEWSLLREWLDDPSFIQWAEHSDRQSVAIWEDYFNQNPEKCSLAKAGKSLILGVPFKEIPRNEQDGLKALSSLLNRLPDEKRGRPNSLVVPSRDRRKHYRIFAASMTILVLISTGIYWQFFHNPHVLLTTPYGQQYQTELPDGSSVTLNANSSLSYQKLDPRKVTLSGEAYFEVNKLPESGEEFVVITNDLVITVLGTSFNVNARNDHTKVFLAEGKVTLDVADSSGMEITMKPGELISYSKRKKELVEQRTDASALKLASWKEGALIFKDTPLTEALFQIEDIYGIQFILQFEPIKKELISGGVPIKNLEVTLSTLREVYGLKMEKRGRRLFIQGIAP